MAEWAAGVRAEPPRIQPVLDHPWERAFLSKNEIQWNIEPGFAKIRWLP